MKVGIISDTHITKVTDKFTILLETLFKEVNLIIHVGDYTCIEVLDTLKKINDFIGVWGNIDDSKIKSVVNEKVILNLEGYKIGIFHGHGHNSNTIDRTLDKFLKDDVDIIIFGHSHQPFLKTKKQVLMLNPGSLTAKRFERWFSYIVLNLEPESIDVQIKFKNSINFEA